MAFSDWLKSVEGKYIEVDDHFGSQCVDLFLDYSKHLFGKYWREASGWGNAKDLFLNSNPMYYQKITNQVGNKTQLPKEGDVIVWGATSTNPYGHIAVVINATASYINVIQQDGFIDDGKRRTGNKEEVVRAGDGNADGVAHRKKRYWTGVIGWLRPIPKQTTQPEGGEMANATQVKNLYKAIMHRAADSAGLKHYTGKDANFIVADFLKSAEFKNHEKNMTDLKKQVASLKTALANEKNKKPEVVVKEVEKIVEKIVEVQTPVDEKAVVTNFFKRVWDSLFKK